MKKLVLFFASLSLASPALFCQNDTLLYMNFNADPSPYFSTEAYPPGNSYDTAWYNIDLDMLTPEGASNGIGPAWFWSLAFADSDTLEFVNCMAARSWFVEIGQAKNYLITPAIPIVDANAVLSWRSAPFQTPRYLDGYKVLISSTTNDIEAFTDTVFVAAEMLQLAPASDTSGNYAAYVFSPGFVHGLDGTYIEPTSSAMRNRGKLRPFSHSLAAYAGKFIFVAFYHDSYDDNLISVDEILVTGTYDPTFGMDSAEQIQGLSLRAYPNPADRWLMLELFAARALDDVQYHIMDASGKLVLAGTLGKIQGTFQKSVDVGPLAPGLYLLRLTENGHSLTQKFMKR
ncbi:MAG: choice-of-anchor J domain-containing protein [Flavobacteriales bacterium]|nr:choice-of-anchor J domain-containing protein [Flavobacteriales bacterium]